VKVHKVTLLLLLSTAEKHYAVVQFPPYLMLQSTMVLVLVSRHNLISCARDECVQI